MSATDPTTTTIGDLAQECLKECGAFGLGQKPLAQDQTDAITRLQWMLQQWERKRWLVYHLVTYGITSTGAQFYTVGPGGQIDTSQSSDPFNPQFNPQFGGGGGAQDPPVSVRPAKIEYAFLRQLQNSQPNQIDYYLEIIQSMEDYNKIALKSLQSFPGFAFYDPAWPLGRLYAWPVPQASIYGVYITIREQLPISFATAASKVTLPYEYYAAMLYNGALRLRPKYGIRTEQGDLLPGLAKDALNVLRASNAAIARLQIPPDMARPGLYNIFADRFY